MISALIYLRLTSLVNTAREKVRRLKQPRYLFGGIVGAAYFYFFFFRHLIGPYSPFAQMVAPGPGVDQSIKPEPIAALIFLLYLLGTWIFSSDRASLGFTEAEVAFLFPAPVSRRSLIHFKLLSGQLRIFFSALFFAFVRVRWGGGPLGFLIQLVGWWTILSCISLHRIGAAFTRERLLDLGLNRWRRRLFAAVLVLTIGGLSYHWAGLTLDELAAHGPRAPLAFLDAFLNTPPLRWILWPARLIVKPILSRTAAGFAVSLPSAFAVLAFHYLWVIKSEVAFEEASLSAARKRAEIIQLNRAGKGWQRAPRKLRSEPFALRAQGARPIAFLWRNLIALGPIAFPKWWATAVIVAFAATRFLLADHRYDPIVTILTVACAIMAGYGFLLSPVFIRQPARRLIEEIDIIKAYPLRGWEIILGEMLAPLLLVSCFEWLMFLIIELIASHRMPGQEALVLAVALGAGQIVPFVSGLLLALNFGSVLYFPAWASQAGATSDGATSAPGMERMGQGILLFIGYMLVAVISLLPAATVGCVIFLPLKLFLGYTAFGAAFSGTGMALTLAGEFAAIVWWLGKRYEGFDLSAELRR